MRQVFRPRTECGFTLIELLVVIAIILILIAIALPNFLEAQTRAKVVRVEADMRTLATAVESYYIDRRIYPYLSVSALEYSHLSDGFRLLTSPIAYLQSLPLDPFSLPHEDQGILPTTGPNYKFNSTTPIPLPGQTRNHNVDAYFIYSIGPNAEDESRFGGHFWPFTQVPNPCAFPSSSNLTSYSPTNGSRSGGRYSPIRGRIPGWELVLGRGDHSRAILIDPR